MIRLAGMFVRLLRYRVAAMIWLFLLLGAAHPDGLDALFSPATSRSPRAIAAATSVNDLADEAIDRVNHPRDGGRPLLHRRRRPARPRPAARAGVGARARAAAPPARVRSPSRSLGIGVAYSVRPVALSYRTWLAPLGSRSPTSGSRTPSVPKRLAATGSPETPCSSPRCTSSSSHGSC